VLSAEAKQSQARLQNAEKSLEATTRGRATYLRAGESYRANASSLADQLEQAKVQVELDQDEVDNASRN